MRKQAASTDAPEFDPQAQADAEAEVLPSGEVPLVRRVGEPNPFAPEGVVTPLGAPRGKLDPAIAQMEEQVNRKQGKPDVVAKCPECTAWVPFHSKRPVEGGRLHCGKCGAWFDHTRAGQKTLGEQA